MEEPEIPLEHLHEQVHHSAEHSRERWISWVALSTAILAVLAAIAGLLSGRYVNEAMMNQIEASDQWSYYQAKSIKASVLDAKISLASTPNESDQSKRDRYARSVCRWRDDVPNRDCHRGNFRAYKKTPVLDRKLAFRGSRLRLSRPRRDREVGRLLQRAGLLRQLSRAPSRLRDCTRARGTRALHF